MRAEEKGKIATAFVNTSPEEINPNLEAQGGQPQPQFLGTGRVPFALQQVFN